MNKGQMVAPVLAKVCHNPNRGVCLGDLESTTKRQKTQPGSLGTEINVPDQLPHSLKQLEHLNAPTIRAILERLNLPSDQNKRTNVATLSRHLKEFGTIPLPRRASTVPTDDNPFLCGHCLPPTDTKRGPTVVCTDDVRASVHVQLDLAEKLIH